MMMTAMTMLLLIRMAFFQEILNISSVTKNCKIQFIYKKVSALTLRCLKANWHHVDPDCYDVLALMRKIASLQKLCWDYDLFSHSDRTLGWMNSRGAHHHRPCQEPYDTPPRLRIPTNGPIFEARKFCTVVVCTHSSVQNCPSAAGLVQACSQYPPEPERLPRFGNHNEPTFCLLTLCHLSCRWIRWVGLKLLCFVLLPSAAAMLFRPVTQRCCCPSGTLRLGLEAAGAW